MNERLLNNNITELIEGLQAIIQSPNNDMPAIYQEIVNYGIAYNLFKTFILLIIILFCFFMSFRIAKQYNYDFKNEEMLLSFTMPLMPAFLFIFFIILIADSLTMAIMAPKLYVLDFLKDFLI